MRAVSDFDASMPEYAEYATRYRSMEVAPADDIREAAHREIARELHDTVIQPLTALVMGLRAQQHSLPADAAGSGSWHELAQEALDALRATLAGLRTHPHVTQGLPDAIRQHLTPPFKHRGLDLHLESMDWPADVPADWTSSLYLAVREAVTNAEKHGHASRVSIILQADAQHLLITITDNGAGFATDEVGADRRARPGSGLGLRAMRDRLRLLGGSLRLMAAPGHGTQVEMCIPVPDIALSPSARAGERWRPVVPRREHVH